MIETDQAYYFASEVGMLEWILARNDVKYKDVTLVKENVEFIIDLNTRAHKEVALPEKKIYTQPTTYGAASTYAKATPHKLSESDLKKAIKDKYLELKDFIGTKTTFYLYAWKYESNNPKRTLYLYKGRTNTGIPIIFRTKSPTFGIDMSKYTYEGMIQGLETIDDVVCFSIRAKTVAEYTPKKTPIITNKEPDITANEESFESLENEDLVDEDVLELGDGQLLTYKAFKQMAKCGCGHCKSNLSLKDHYNYALSPGGRSLLCGNCTAELICDTATFTEKFFKNKGTQAQ
jgi:hypothetical protein